MSWTTYIFDVEDLRLEFMRAELEHSRDCPIVDDYIRESVYEYLISESLERTMLKRSGQFKPVYLRNEKVWRDLGHVYYDYVGHLFENRMLDILDSRCVHHMPGEIVKSLIAGNTLFLTRKNYHLR